MKHLLCCLLLASTWPALAQTTPWARELVREGVALYDQGQYEAAIAKYQQALVTEPDQPIAQAELALTYNALGRHAEARALCEQLLQRHPDAGASVYVTYGNSLDALGKFKDAEQAYRQGIKQFPDDPDTYSLYYNLGIAQAGHKLYPEAIASYRQAVVLNPRHASSHLNLGQTHARLRQQVPAVLALARFLALEPQSARAQRNLPLLQRLLSQGVTRQDSTHTTITISQSVLDAATSQKVIPDNFGQVELVLSAAAAQKQGATAPEQLIAQFTTLGKLLQELAAKGTPPGFTWAYYAPYFAEMQRRGFVPAFAYLAFAKQPASAAPAQQWLAAHPTEVQGFQEWSKSYEWPKEVGK